MLDSFPQVSWQADETFFNHAQVTNDVLLIFAPDLNEVIKIKFE